MKSSALFALGLALIVCLCAPAEIDAAEHAAAPPAADAESAPAAHQASQDHAAPTHDSEHQVHTVPNLFWIAPFVTILMCIAILPLIPQTEHWWHKNGSKLKVAIVLSLITLAYYFFRSFGMGHGGHESGTGWPTVLAALHHAVIADYIPFIVLLFALYTISGGIRITGDIPAHPKTNTLLLAIGAFSASFIGTTGASMLLIRPLLQINSERHKVVHTVIFFIFLVSNVGGCLLPIGDPPLFLGYLRGVPFTWTLGLWKPWLFTVIVLLAIYYVWDSIAYSRETKKDIILDETIREPIKMTGKINLLWLAGVIAAVAFLVPGKTFPGTNWIIPPFLREAAQLGFAGISWIVTPLLIRKANQFNFFAIAEVACLFVGIFICMQVPVEILKLKGGELGLSEPWHFFWATGTLSSFLDNAPTYAVYFETASALGVEGAPGNLTFHGVSGIIHMAEALLVAISLGAVFMGAMTYIGNGPNFMVKSIAEQAKIKMPSFFGYMVYSCAILLPVFILSTVIFLRSPAAAHAQESPPAAVAPHQPAPAETHPAH